MLQKRIDTKDYLIQKLHEACEILSERPIVIASNDISFGMTLDSFGENASFLGSMLFQRCASGVRVLCNSGTKPLNVGGIEFINFGQSYDKYPHTYMTIAAALGTQPREVDAFFSRLLECVKQYKKKHPIDIPTH